MAPAADPVRTQATVEPATGAHLPRVPALDGLRGLAVLGVVLYHSGLGGAGGGFLGVSTFFTLSGFLITSLLLVEHERTGTIELLRFWVRRARRLLPAAFLTIAAIIVGGALVANGHQADRLPGDALSALAYVANWRFVLGDQSYAALFSDPSPFQHFWSLAIEEQFYLVFPLVVVATFATVRDARRGLARVLTVLTAASIASAVLLAHPAAEPSRVYYGTDTRAAELLLGALLACAIGGRTLTPSRRARRLLASGGAAALAALVVAWFVVDLGTPFLYQGDLALHAVLTALVIAAAHVGGPVRRTLSWRPLRGLGLISYGVYLFHWPIFVFLDPARTGVDGLPLFALRMTVTLAAALASYHLVEIPIRTGARWRRPRALALLPVTAGALAVSALVVPIGSASAPIVFAPVHSARAALRPAPPVHPPPVVSTLPLTGGSATAAPVQRIMIVGDSVGQTLGRGLERWGPPHGIRVLNAARFYCAIVRGGEIGALLGKHSSPQCERWAQQWGADLDVFHPDVVVVLSTFWDVAGRRRPEWGPKFLAPGDAPFDEWVVSEWRSAVELLSSRGARVVWLNDPCDRNPDVTHWLDYANAHYIPALAAGGTATIDLDAHVCPGGAFSNTIDGVDDARPDGLHFSDPGADAVAAWLGPQLTRDPSGGPDT